MKQLFPFIVNDPLPSIKQITKISKYGYWDNDREILDLTLGSCGCFPLGFNRTDLVDAVSAQLKTSPFCQGDFATTHPLVTDLSQKLYDLSKGFYPMYSLSGSDAIEGAVKMVQMFHKDSNRKKIIGFNDSYHGSTYMSSSVGGTKPMTGISGKHYDCITIAYEDLENTIDETTAAVFIETASWGANNLGKINAEYFKKIRELCNDTGTLMVIDDIAFCGGKTGTVIGFESLGVTPDIFCLGKGISGGYFPISMTMIGQLIADKIKPQFLAHGYSYSFPMSGIISTLEYLKILDQENILEQHQLIVDNGSKIMEDLLSAGLITSWQSYGVCFSLTPTTIIYNDLERDQHFYNNGLHLGVWNQNSNRILIMMPIAYDTEYFVSLRTKLIDALS